MSRILITTVSNHTGQHGNPTELILNKVKPDYAYFFVSPESLIYAQTIAKQSYLEDHMTAFPTVTDPFDLEHCYQKAKQTLEQASQIMPNPWLHLDITAGTKPMSMALLINSYQLLDQLDERIFITYIQQDPNNKQMHLRYLPDKRFTQTP